jgi:lantibiotic biosynthesis protein
MRADGSAEDSLAPVDQQLLSVAKGIAEQLCQCAIWDGPDTCHWEGPDRLDVETSDSRIEIVDLGSDLYHGSAGIALFLLESYRIFKRASFLKTALGGLNRAIERPPSGVFAQSFYAGSIGIAYAIEVALSLTPFERLRIAQKRMLSEVLDGPFSIPSAPLDLVNGAAGSILGLLSLHEIQKETSLLRAAAAFGRRLCGAAIWSASCCEWDVFEVQGYTSTHPMLLGLAHGASGLALALISLYQKTGDADFLTTSRGAFAYVTASYRPENGDWPDFRHYTNQGDRQSVAHFNPSWCHGVSGIALAYMVAARIDAELGQTYEELANAALGTILRLLETLSHQQVRDISLCHGTLGFCEVLNSSRDYGFDPLFSSNAHAVVRRVLSQYDKIQEIPTDLSMEYGINPALLAGLAGVGHLCLRLHSRLVRPILFVSN